MTNTAAPIQGTAPVSTTLDVGASSVAVGAGAPPPEVKQPEPKQESPGDTMRAELARQRAEEAKDADKVKAQGEDAAKDAKAKVDDAEKAEADKVKADPEKDAKPEAKAKADAEEPADKADKSAAEKPAAGQEADKSRQSEGSKRVDPPARFLPEATAKWGNVPTEVKAEIHRVSQEYESEIAKGKQATERYERIRQFDETAQKNGRELKDSLSKVVQIEQALARSPVLGLEMILREIGPRKQDGSPLSLYDVAQHVAKLTPQQFAQNMQGAVSQPRQHAQQPNPEVAALKAELSEIKSALAQQQGAPIIQDFAASHPDYHALQPKIAEVLKSGVIEKIYGTGLSPAQKLEQAYRMAGGQSPSRSEPEPTPKHSAANADRPVDPDGTKSIRGAPTGGADPDDDGDDATDLRKLLEREKRKLAS